MSAKKHKVAVVVDAVLAAAQAADKLKRQEDAQKKQDDLKLYDHRVKKMTFRQIRGELKRQARVPRDGSLLTAALSSALLTVLDNTKTPQNPFGKLHSYPV